MVYVSRCEFPESTQEQEWTWSVPTWRELAASLFSDRFMMVWAWQVIIQPSGFCEAKYMFVCGKQDGITCTQNAIDGAYTHIEKEM